MDAVGQAGSFPPALANPAVARKHRRWMNLAPNLSAARRQVAVGFEPTKNGFAIRSPLVAATLLNYQRTR